MTHPADKDSRVIAASGKFRIVERPTWVAGCQIAVEKRLGVDALGVEAWGPVSGRGDDTDGVHFYGLEPFPWEDLIKQLRGAK